MTKPLDLTGRTFGEWEVVRVVEAGNGVDRKSWFCRCSCGNTATVSTSNLTSGASTGCRTCAVATHGCSRKGPHKQTYFVWRGMRDRCVNPDNPAFPAYGGRGIYVCDQWLRSFEAFLSDMGKKPAGRSLDRVDNDGPYAPENCRWATPTEQSHNSRAVRYITVNGDSRIVSDWARYFGVPIPTMFYHVRKRGDVGAVRHLMGRA